MPFPANVAAKPTEATVAVTQVEITPEILEKYDRLPIGYVKEDTEITIDLSQGDDGKSGEMIIAGPSVSKAYINNPEKTEEAFFLFVRVEALQFHH